MEASDHLGTVVRHQGTKYQVVAIEGGVDDPMLVDSPTLVGETPEGHTCRWDLPSFEDVEVVTAKLDAPDRPDPVVEISVNDGLLSESQYYQDNAVVQCRECGELVREPDATPHMGDPTDAHGHDSWTCDSCSQFSSTDGCEAEVLDVTPEELDGCPYARWSDRLQAWTIGTDYRVDDGIWQPESVESAVVEVPSDAPSTTSDDCGDGPTIRADGGRTTSTLDDTASVTHPRGACDDCGEPLRIVPCLNCSARRGDRR